MFLDKATLRKASGRVALLLATGSLLATGIAPANAADTTPLYLSFESSDPLKNVAAAGGAFGGAGAVTSASTNLTGDALKFTKGNEPWSGVNILGAESTPYRYADGTKTTVTFDYFSNDTAASPVLVKLERAGGGSVQKAVAAQPGLNKIVADMSTGTGWNAATEYKQLIIFPNFSTDDSGYSGVGPVANTGQVYEIDNISINGGTVADIYSPVIPTVREATSTLLTFEAADTLGATAIGAGFEGASTAIVDAPVGGNGGKVLEITKSGNAWSGVNLVTAPAGVKFDKVVTMNYFSPETVNTPVQFQLLATGSTISQAVEAVPGWQKLTFDFTATFDATKEYTRAVIFPNFVNGGDVPGYTGAVAAPMADKKFAIDNVGFNGATTPAIAVPRVTTSTLLTFEDADTLGANAVGVSEGDKLDGSFEGATTAIVTAPTGGNGGKVLEFTKSGQPWSGVNLVTAPAGVKFDKIVTLNYFSPETVSTPAMMHLLAVGGGYIAQAVTTVPGWQKLTFDFTATYNGAKDYTRAVLFPNFVNAADVPGYTGAAAAPMADKKYAIDNVGFNGATTPAIAVPRTATSTLLTFETGDEQGAKVVGEADAEKAEGGFEGALTSIVDAPAGGNGGKALKIVKNVGAQIYAGVNMVKYLSDTRVTNGTHKTISFNYYSAKANSPVNVEVRPYPRALGKVVLAPLGWSTITVDFSTVAGWTETEEFIGVTIFPDFNQPAGTVALAYYVDNLAFNGATTPSIPVVVPKVKPSVRTAASVMGSSTKVAKTLTAGKGLWSGSSTIAYTYKWYRCSVSSTKTATTAPTSSAKCATISGATKSTYKLASADVGKYIRVLITAKNTAGTAYSLSKTSAKVVK